MGKQRKGFLGLLGKGKPAKQGNSTQASNNNGSNGAASEGKAPMSVDSNKNILKKAAKSVGIGAKNPAPYYPKPKANYSVLETLQARSKVGKATREVPYAYTELLLRRHAETKAILGDLAKISQLTLSICGLVAAPYTALKWMFESTKQGYASDKLIIKAPSAIAMVPLAVASGAVYMPTQLLTYAVDSLLKEALYIVDHYLQGLWRNSLHGSAFLHEGYESKNILHPDTYGTTKAFKSEKYKGTPGPFTTLFAENNRNLAKRSVQLPTKLSEVKLSSLLLQVDRALHVILTLPYALMSVLQHKSRDFKAGDHNKIAKHAFYGAATGLNFLLGLATELTSFVVDAVVFSHLVSAISFVEDRLTGQENNLVNTPVAQL